MIIKIIRKCITVFRVVLESFDYELLKKLYSEMSAGFFSGSRKKLLPLLYKEPQPHTDKSVSNIILTANTSCF